MIKITISIKEEKSNKIFNHCLVDVQEKGIYATESEKQISNVILDRIRVDEKLQILDSDDNDIKDKIIEQLLKD